MSSPSAHPLNLCGVLSETKRIISAHSRHFLALSVLFLLPISFSFILYPFPSRSTCTLYDYHQSLPQLEQIPPIDKSDLLLPVVYAVFALLLILSATASITYSTYHGFHGRPVTLESSIMSVLFSILPLVGTLIVVQVIVGLVTFAFRGFTALVYNSFAVLGFEIDFTNVYFLAILIVLLAALVGFLLYLKVEWFLSSVVVVLELRWGFAPLKRSSYLVRGMRKVAFLMISFFGILIVSLGVLCASLVANMDGVSEMWVSWVFVFQAVVYTASMTILMLYYISANAVLFIYCKALRGELSFEIAEEFSQEYVSLPFDDGKVSQVVYVV